MGAISTLLRSRHAAAAVTLAILLLLFFLLKHLAKIPDYIVPPLSAILSEYAHRRDYYALHAAYTLLEAVAGLAVASLLGACLGIWAGAIAGTGSVVLLIATAIQTIPIVAFAPLMIVWLGNGTASKVALVSVMCLFPVVVNVARGIRSVPAAEKDLVRVFGGSAFQAFSILQLPRGIAALAQAVRLIAPMAMLAAIVAEYAGADRGLGYVIVQAAYRLDTAVLFAAVGVSALSGVVMFWAVKSVEGLVRSRWRLP